MRMQKRRFRIGELAQNLNIEKFVIRFWEKEFGLSSDRSHGGQRFYDETDLARFKAIKTLLYEEGFTIAGARKHLKEQTKTVVGARKTVTEKAPAQPDNSNEWHQELAELKQQLVKLSSLL